MKKSSILLLALLMLVAFACSDGAQIASQVGKLVKNHEVETIAIELNGEQSVIDLPKPGKTKGAIVDGQFIYFEGEYINLGRVKTMSVNAKTLELAF